LIRWRHSGTSKSGEVTERTFSFLLGLFEFLQSAGHIAHAFVHEGKDGSRLEFSVAIFLAGNTRGEDFDALFDFGDGPDMEFARGDGIEDVFAEHEVFDIGLRHHHALGAGEAFDAADVKKAFDLLIHTTDGLNIALLVHRAGDGDERWVASKIGSDLNIDGNA
jgi:hypothetical protein